MGKEGDDEHVEGNSFECNHFNFTRTEAWSNILKSALIFVRTVKYKRVF